MNLTAHLGDTRIFSIPLRWGNRPFVPGSEWHLVFTAKINSTDDDGDAPIQLESGNGVTAIGGFASVAVARSLTVDLDPGSLYWDVQAEKLDSDEVRTVAIGRLHLLREVTHVRKSVIGTGSVVLDENGLAITDDQLQPLVYA